MKNKMNPIIRLFKIMRYAARGLIILWAIWWIFFGVVTIFSEPLELSSILIGIGIIIIFSFSAVCPWFWERLAAIILLVEGIIILIGYPIIAFGLPVLTIISMEISLALPPLLTGMLFYVLSKTVKRRNPVNIQNQPEIES
ncbi:hypothetical protein JXI42_12255 [bacterium]|nr:hypothetical protein [bacterium]